MSLVNLLISSRLGVPRITFVVGLDWLSPLGFGLFDIGIWFEFLFQVYLFSLSSLDPSPQDGYVPTPNINSL